MVDNVETGSEVKVVESAIFVVRQGEGESASYAICHRVATESGGHRLAGTSKTLAELVDEQNLSAALVPPGDSGPVKSFSFEPQSGRDVNITN